MPKVARAKKIPKEKPYSVENIKEALAEVRSGSLTINQASKRFKIPKTSLHNKLTGRYSEDCANGRPTTLSKAQEDELVKWILGCADGWHPIGKEQVLDSVQILCRILNIKNNFANGRPGDAWYRKFLQRHPEISLRKPKNFSVERAEVTEEDLMKWFESVQQYFSENDLMNISANRVYNCDESAFFLTPEDGKVLARRGSSAVPALKNSGQKECLTVLFMMSAAGQVVPPMAVHKVDAITPNIAIHNAEGWRMGTSPGTGWMDGPLFYEYITNVFFFPWLKSEAVEFPVILYLDGHASHVTQPLLTFCNENKIVLILLYPNATHLIQPLDTVFFATLKKAYVKEVRKWRMQNYAGVRFQPLHVAKVLENSLPHMNLPVILQNGFRSCGLLPFNPTVVANMKLLKTKKSENLVAETQSLPETDTLSSTLVASDYEATVRVLEQQIPPDTLLQFNECREERFWNGSVEDENLFYLWCDVKERQEALFTQATISIEENENNFSSSATSDDASQPNDVVLDARTFLNEDSGLGEDISLNNTLVLEPIENGPIINTQNEEISFPEVEIFVDGANPDANTQEQPVFKTLKEHVFWPGELPKRRQKKKTTETTVRFPFVVSSEEVIADKINKINREKERIAQIAQRKLKNKEKKRVKDEERKKNRLIREQNKKIKEELKEQEKQRKLEQKKLKDEQRKQKIAGKKKVKNEVKEETQENS